MTDRTRRDPVRAPPHGATEVADEIIPSLIPSGVKKAPFIATEKVTAGLKSLAESGAMTSFPRSNPGNIAISDISDAVKRDSVNTAIESEMKIWRIIRFFTLVNPESSKDQLTK